MTGAHVIKMSGVSKPLIWVKKAIRMKKPGQLKKASIRPSTVPVCMM